MYVCMYVCMEARTAKLLLAIDGLTVKALFGLEQFALLYANDRLTGPVLFRRTTQLR